jgi:hypothetical protein
MWFNCVSMTWRAGGWRTSLATPYDAIELKKQGLKMRFDDMAGNITAVVSTLR